MTSDLKHLTILTGASRGLGLAMATQLLQPGQQLLTLSRQRNDALQARADATGVALEQWAADLGAPADVAARLAAWLAALDGAGFASVTLINNAAALSEPLTLADSAAAGLANSVRVGLEAPLLLTAAFLHATAGWPGARRVLNISSGLGRRAMAGAAAYCAIKAGLDHLSRALALEEAALPNGAKVVSLAPGVIDTDMQVQLRGADPLRFPEQQRFAALKAGGLLDTPAQAAAKVLALLARPDFGSDVIADVRDA
jgi:NAD(P)-dependent dehydrogenase (short-subunit alcohol dehydrogenase family)